MINLLSDFVTDYAGLAFAMLASLPPATGLYTAMIPVIVYMLMGTSKSLSQGMCSYCNLVYSIYIKLRKE